MRNVENFETDFESLENIEAMILAAGTYVRPSEDLRPKILERTEEREQTQIVIGNSLWISMAVMLLASWSIGCFSTPVPMQRIAHLLAQGAFTSGTELCCLNREPCEQARAQAVVDSPPLETELAWRAVHAAKALRSFQAEALRDGLHRTWGPWH
jgi:hypothetical protein